MITRLHKNRLFIEAVFYSVATAINRGLTFLALPFLGQLLTIEEFGIWSLTQVLVSLGAPVLSLNGGSGILREGVGNPSLGRALLQRFSKESLKLAALACVSLIFLPVDWVFFTIIMVITEGFASLVMGWYRSQDRHFLYFFVVFTRLLALAGAIFIVRKTPELSTMLFYQCLFGIVSLVPFLIHGLATKSDQLVAFNFRPILIFCLHLIPHGFAQWVISGSDRIVIKTMLGNASLGHYSLAYTLGLSIMLINSGMGMTVGVDIIKNYDVWSQTTRRTKAIAFYSALYILASSALIGGAKFFSTELSFLKDVNELTLRLMPWILDGMYFMGIYLFFINYLNYLRESVLLSSITAGTAVFNVALTITLIPIFGVEGAAISTFISYFALMAASFWYAVTKARLKPPHHWIDLAIIVSTVIVNQLVAALIISF